MLALIERVCLRCHHEGGNAPYEFRDGAMLRRVAQTAAEALRRGTMPPWLPTQSPDGFLNVPSITESERANLIRWFAESAKESEGWVAPAFKPASGTPGVVTMRFGEGWQTPAEPDLLYARTFLRPIDGGFPLRFRGFDYRPRVAGAIEMVMLNADTSGMGRELDERDGAIGAAFHADLGPIPAGTLGAAGVLPNFRLPDGYTFAIAPGADLLAEAHARTLGRSVQGDFELSIIPAREGDVRVVESYAVGAPTTGGAARRANLTIEYLCDTLDAPMKVLAILPNTGIRCRTYDLDLIRRTGEREGVLNIPVYQAWADRMYVLRTPLAVGPGDRFTLRVSHTDGYALLHTHASAVLLVTPSEVASAATIPLPVGPSSVARTSDPIGMIAVPAGKVVIATGAGVVEVSVATLRVARNETSVAEFAKVLGRTPRPLDANDTRDSQVDPDFAEAPHPLDATLPVDPGLPCVSVSFYDAIEYCNALSKSVGLPERYALSDVARREDGSIARAVVRSNAGSGYRLLTEAEWERVALAGGDDSWCLKADEPAPSGPRAAAAGRPNALGIVNLRGNVWEWCEDGFTTTRIAPPTVGDAAASPIPPTNRGRVVKGGSFADSEKGCVPAFRSGLPPSSRAAVFGFRVARDG